MNEDRNESDHDMLALIVIAIAVAGISLATFALYSERGKALFREMARQEEALRTH